MKHILTIIIVIVAFSLAQAQENYKPLIKDNAILLTIGDANLAYERKLFRNGNVRVNARVGLRPLSFYTLGRLAPTAGVSLVNSPDKSWHFEFTGNWIQGGAFATLGFRYQKPEQNFLIFRTGIGYGRYGYNNDFFPSIYFGIGFAF